MTLCLTSRRDHHVLSALYIMRIALVFLLRTTKRIRKLLLRQRCLVPALIGVDTVCERAFESESERERRVFWHCWRRGLQTAEYTHPDSEASNGASESTTQIVGDVLPEASVSRPICVFWCSSRMRRLVISATVTALAVAGPLACSRTGPCCATQRGRNQHRQPCVLWVMAGVSLAGRERAQDLQDLERLRHIGANPAPSSDAQARRRAAAFAARN